MATGVGAEEYRLPGRPLGKLLQALENETRKSCDDEKGAISLFLCTIQQVVSAYLWAQRISTFTVSSPAKLSGF